MTFETEPKRNVAVIEELYAAFRRSDLEAVLALLAPKLEFNENAPPPFGGRYHGHAGFQELMGKLAAAPGHTEFETLSLSGDRDRVTALNHLRRVGLDREADVVELFTFADGLICRVDVLPVDPATWPEFWA